MPFQIVQVAIGISLLIFLHELGHFLAAKLAGVRVEAFSLGFGPVLFGFRRGHTHYRLSAIPLGGYVKMAGEAVEDEVQGEPWEFLSKTPGQRAVVFAAGVIMNLIFAFIAFVVAFSIGVKFTPMIVGEVEHGSAAWVAGLEPGDEIVGLNGKPIEDFEDFAPKVAFSEPGELLMLEIIRDGKPMTKSVRCEYDAYAGRPRIGVQPAYTLEIASITAFDGKSPAADAGLRVRDKIIEANGPVKTWADLERVIIGSPGKPVKLKVDRGGKIFETTVVPATTKRYMIGLSCQETLIKAVRDDSPASQAGLRAGDKLVQVDGQDVAGWNDVIKAALACKKPALAFAAKRGKTAIKGSMALAEGKPVASVLADIVPHTGLVVDAVLDGLPAKAAGIQRGDELLSLRLKNPSGWDWFLDLMGLYRGTLARWDDLVDTVKASAGAPLLLTYRRDGREFVQEIAAEATDLNAGGRIGISPQPRKILRRYGFGKALAKGVSRSISSAGQVYLTIRSLLTRRVAGKNIGGIGTIVQVSYYKAKEGFTELLYLLGIISVNLAVLNALPIPVLDGGHLLFVVIEKLKGKPVPERVQHWANCVGLALLGMLIVFATCMDIIRLKP